MTHRKSTSPPTSKRQTNMTISKSMSTYKKKKTDKYDQFQISVYSKKGKTDEYDPYQNSGQLIRKKKQTNMTHIKFPGRR